MTAHNKSLGRSAGNGLLKRNKVRTLAKRMFSKRSFTINLHIVIGTVHLKRTSYRIQGHDPSDAFMNRFKIDIARVQVRSQRRGYKGSSLGDRGVLLAVPKIDWVNDRNVLVIGSCNAAMLDDFSYSYRAVRRSRKWIVTGAKVTGIA